MPPTAFLWDAKQGLIPHAQIELPPDRQGVILTDTFSKGCMAVATIKADDRRFIKPVGFARHELLHEEAFKGYYQLTPQAAPRPLRMFAEELIARAIGIPVHSPRGQPDRIARMEWIEFEKPALALLLYKDQALLREERGAGDLQPRLTKPEQQCIADGTLYVTSASRDKVALFTRSGIESQDLLFGGALSEHIAHAETAVSAPGVIIGP